MNSVAYYFSLIAMLGIANYGNRVIASVREDREKLNYSFSSVFSLQVFTYIIAVMAYILYVVVFLEENKAVAAIHTIYVFSGMVDISWLYFGLECFKTTVFRNAVIKVLTAACIFLFVDCPADLWKYSLIMVLGQILSQLSLWIGIRKFVSFIVVPVKEVLGHFKPAIILFIPVLAFSLYKVMDKLMLGNMSTFEQVGLYANAEKLVGIPISLITALGTVMMPRVTNCIFNNEMEKVGTYLDISSKIVIVVAVASGFGLFAISDVVAVTFFGEEFASCAELIRLLAVVPFFVGLANVIRTQYLIPHHCDRVYVISTIVGAVLNLIVNLVLIGKLHAVGAAIGTIIAEASVLLVQLYYVRACVPIHKTLWEYKSVFLVGLMMMGIVRCVGQTLDMSVGGLVIQVLAGALFFCVGLIIVLVSKKDSLWCFLRDEIN